VIDQTDSAMSPSVSAGWWECLNRQYRLLSSTIVLLSAAAWLTAPSTEAGKHNLKFNRSMFEDVSSPCSRTGVFQAVLNKTNPTAFIKLDIRYKTLVTYQTFDCIIKVKTEFTNKSREFYNDNEDIAVMMFDMNYGYLRKQDQSKLDLIHIARLDENTSRFFYQKKQFLLPQFVPNSLTGYVLYGFEEMAQWHAESNTSVALHLKRWKSSGSIYLVFTQYRIVSPYHCDKGIEVDCSDSTAVFAHCFPSPLLPLLLDGLPFCDFHPIHSIGSNKTTCGSPAEALTSEWWISLIIVSALALL